MSMRHENPELPLVHYFLFRPFLLQLSFLLLSFVVCFFPFYLFIYSALFSFVVSSAFSFHLTTPLPSCLLPVCLSVCLSPSTFPSPFSLVSFPAVTSILEYFWFPALEHIHEYSMHRNSTHCFHRNTLICKVGLNNYTRYMLTQLHAPK